MIDGDGKIHKFLTNIAHHVRKAGQNKLKTLRETFSEDPEITIIDYPEDAAPSDYSEYATQLSSHKSDEITYRAIYVYGKADKVIPLTKNLSRL